MNLPIELIGIIYEKTGNEEKAILNRIYKLNYKRFNPIKGLLKFKTITPTFSSFINPSDNTNHNVTFNTDKISINGYRYNYELNDKIHSLERKLRKQSDQIEILLNILYQKNIIPKIEI